METDSKLKVFLVDDDPAYCAAMEQYISNEMPGATMYVFPNGEACLHEMNTQPDLVLLDYRLDSEVEYAWDGLQVLKKINSVNPDVPVVLLSAGEDVETAVECINQGAMEYIVKNEHAFEKVKAVLSTVKDELAEEEEVKVDATRNAPQLIGLVILIIFVVVLLASL